MMYLKHSAPKGILGIDHNEMLSPIFLTSWLPHQAPTLLVNEFMDLTLMLFFSPLNKVT